MSGNRCYRQNMETLFVSTGALGELMIMYALFTAVSLLFLPGKPYFFYIAQEVVPGTFTAVSVSILFILLFLSIRHGLEVSDPESVRGVPVWLQQEHLSSRTVWLGTVVSSMVHALVQVSAALPFILMAGSLSGVSISSILATVLCIAVVQLFFLLVTMVFSLLRGASAFTGIFLTGLVLFALFLGTLGPGRFLNPVAVLISIAGEGAAGEGVAWAGAFPGIYGGASVFLFFLLGTIIRRREP